MNRVANDNRIETAERKLQIFAYSIVRMRSDLVDAGGPHKRALLKLIGMSQRRIAQLKKATHFLGLVRSGQL
jgi:hypothetical protein